MASESVGVLLWSKLDKKLVLNLYIHCPQRTTAIIADFNFSNRSKYNISTSTA